MKMLTFFVVTFLSYGIAGCMDHPIRSSRSENRSTPFPYSEEWEDILFYNRGEPYYEFTNFYSAPILLDGKEWPTTEHYFQAQRFPNNPGIQEYIRTKCRSGRDAFNAARADRNQHAVIPKDEWSAIKWGAMYRAVKAKFKQHADLKKLLLSTGNKVLVEHAAPDTYWGIGINPKTGKAGYNNLGIILMKVRDKIRAHEASSVEGVESVAIKIQEPPQSLLTSLKSKFDNFCKNIKNLYQKNTLKS